MSESTAVQERPIVFSAEQVRAILAGKKTQTRRVVKPQLPDGADTLRDVPYENRWWAATMRQDDAYTITYMPLGSDQQHDWRCPYGILGDRLWVRESFCLGYRVGPKTWSAIRPSDGRAERRAFYRATDSDPPDEPQRHWKPSIHMPRWASRITLEITEVRVQRLQEITGEDCRAEGITPGEGVWAGSTKRAFIDLWDRINGKKHPWASNPWVWALTFRRLST